MGKQFIGIDIGTGHAKLAVLDGQKVLQAVLCELPEGLVRDGRITSFEAMSDVIKGAIKDNKIGGDVYFFSDAGIDVGATGVFNVGRLTLVTT